MRQAGRVEDHYASAGIAARILAALRAAQGEDVPLTPEALAPLDHFHGRGLQATKELAARLAPQPGESVLDIGGGIGGPARWMAARFGCRVTSLDLTAEFCRAAVALNAATGLADRVPVVQGSAAALPFADRSFDRAYSENVTMNVADKPGFYAEALRVLRPGGVLAVTTYGAGPNGAPHYPVPWAAGPETSFLATPEQTSAAVRAAGFVAVSVLDQTAAVLPALRENRRRLEQQGLPRLGIQVLMGERIRQLQINVAISADEGRLCLLEILARRPD